MEPTIFADAALCGALPLSGQPVTMAVADGGASTHVGGRIQPGQYELVAARGTTEGTWQSVLVFAESGAKRTQHQKLTISGFTSTSYESGKWSTSANQLTLSTACSSEGSTTIGDRTVKYSVRQEGCDVFLDIADDVTHFTYRRLHD
ncbi:MAG: hypothetical protein EOP08_05150 [Proteobacteria bacterium]|nr:MAG: hypothetical protein EOP08_05150 [Pseudomonadota bacterium]